MNKVILVRMEVKHEFEYEADAIADSCRTWLSIWQEDLDAWSVEVVNEDPA